MISDEELSAFSDALVLDDGFADERLRERLAAAEAAHRFRLAPAIFGGFVACRLDRERPFADALATLDLTDLYLACGCIEGIAGAAEAFVARFTPEIAAVAAKFARSRGVTPDDLVQSVVERMLVAADGVAPRLALYRGTGPLGGFVRVTAARLAVNAASGAANRAESLAPEDGLFGALLVSSRTPEASLQQERARSLLREAFARAAAGLEARDRNVLAYSLCDGLSIDTIGRMYGVHRATVARWVQSARDMLVRGTRDELARELALSDEQVDTLLRGGLSRFELSVERCLRAESA